MDNRANPAGDSPRAAALWGSVAALGGDLTYNQHALGNFVPGATNPVTMRYPDPGMNGRFSLLY